MTGLVSNFDRGFAVVVFVHRYELAHDGAVAESGTSHVAPVVGFENTWERQNRVVSIHSQLGNGGGAVVTFVTATDGLLLPEVASPGIG